MRASVMAAFLYRSSEVPCQKGNPSRRCQPFTSPLIVPPDSLAEQEEGCCPGGAGRAAERIHRDIPTRETEIRNDWRSGRFFDIGTA